MTKFHIYKVGNQLASLWENGKLQQLSVGTLAAVIYASHRGEVKKRNSQAVRRTRAGMDGGVSLGDISGCSGDKIDRGIWPRGVKTLNPRLTDIHISKIQWFK